MAILENRPETEMLTYEASMRLLQHWIEYESRKAGQVRNVSLTAEGKLSGGIRVPVGTIRTVDARRDETDFHSQGRACFDVVKNGIIALTVFEDEVVYLRRREA